MMDGRPTPRVRVGLSIYLSIYTNKKGSKFRRRLRIFEAATRCSIGASVKPANGAECITMEGQGIYLRETE